MLREKLFAEERGVGRRFSKYAIVGIATNLTGYVLYLVLTALGGGPKTTMTVLYVTGAILAYLGNSRWTFGASPRSRKVSSFAYYLAAHLSGYAINFAMLWLFVDRWGFPHQIVQGIAIIVVAFYLFALFNFVLFVQRPQARSLR